MCQTRRATLPAPMPRPTSRMLDLPLTRAEYSHDAILTDRRAARRSRHRRHDRRGGTPGAGRAEVAAAPNAAAGHSENPVHAVRAAERDGGAAQRGPLVTNRLYHFVVSRRLAQRGARPDGF